MNNNQRIHFIAIGGSIMHNLAIALKEKGHQVTGSDDEVYEPSKSRLDAHGLLPSKQGWDTASISEELDAVILGMHARADNPELLKAQEMGLKIYSFPEYIYEQSKNKQRIVIAGSHGKTSITSVIMHVLQFFDRKFDYAVGAQLNGFENMVKITDAPIIIIEGDEYLSSPIDRTPKFLKYHHHIGLISGISWDHINVFPTEEEYVKQFELFADQTPKSGSLAFYENDSMTMMLGNKERPEVVKIPYTTLPHTIENSKTYLTVEKENYLLKVFGRHNLQNLSGAKGVLGRIGISEEQFYEAIQSFEGASRRMEKVAGNDNTTVYRDYAHAPSKVQATTLAVKEQYPERELVACLELHTFSSLNKDFLSQYKDTMKYANKPVVYFNPETVAHKQLPAITKEDIKTNFATSQLEVFDNIDELKTFLKAQKWENKNLIMMSSGNFNDLDMNELSSEII
jgi:UDP-N-acetylmuramate: L-alanyl-gamma-D-glutamyl-meso-diaminopimelate ligase